MVLTERDMDEISDKVHNIATEVLQQLAQQYFQTLGRVQKDLDELQLQAAQIHEDFWKVNGATRILVQGQGTSAEIIPQLLQDVRVLPFLAGLVHTDTKEQHALLDRVPKMGMILGVMQLDSLCALLQGVMEELCIWEHQAVTTVSEIKVNNQQLFTKRMQIIQEKEVLQVHSA